jgi:DNA-binding transcriptional MerR regulator
MKTTEISKKHGISERTLMKLCELGLFGSSNIRTGRGNPREISPMDITKILLAKEMLELRFTTYEIVELIEKSEKCGMMAYLEDHVLSMKAHRNFLKIIPQRLNQILGKSKHYA